MAKVGAGGSFLAAQDERIGMRKGRPADGLFLLDNRAQVVRKKVHCLSPRLPERIECRSARRKELSAGPRAICCGARFEFEAHNG
jgi:hypothetical protein